MKGFPYITAAVCLIIGAKYSDKIMDIVKDIPVVGDWLNNKTV